MKNCDASNGYGMIDLLERAAGRKGIDISNRQSFETDTILLIRDALELRFIEFKETSGTGECRLVITDLGRAEIAEGPYSNLRAG